MFHVDIVNLISELNVTELHAYGTESCVELNGTTCLQNVNVHNYIIYIIVIRENPQLHVSVGLAQACPNYLVRGKDNSGDTV